jgi:hypothetical protein
MPGRNPWGWVTDERVTLALKILMILVLAAYLGHFLIGFFARIRGIVYILIGAVFFAYLIYPAVHWLTRWMRRIYAILIVYAGILAVLGVAGTFLLPRIVSDIGQIVAQTPATVASINAMLNDPNDPVMSKLPPWMRAELVKIPDQAILWIKVHGVETVGKAMVLLMGTFVAIATFVIIPLITAYLLLDLDNLRNGLSAVIPPKRWRATLDFLHDVRLSARRRPRHRRVYPGAVIGRARGRRADYHRTADPARSVRILARTPCGDRRSDSVRRRDSRVRAGDLHRAVRQRLGERADRADRVRRHL